MFSTLVHSAIGNAPAPTCTVPHCPTGGPLSGPAQAAGIIVHENGLLPACATCGDDAHEDGYAVAWFPALLAECGDECDSPTVELLQDEGCDCVRSLCRVLAP